ncbi:MAG: DUF2029 domain-containing protein [Planctomycetes bacterium]|nr:DUF2029 domain-containing protein [Planctomycetota bacterium]
MTDSAGPAPVSPLVRHANLAAVALLAVMAVVCLVSVLQLPVGDIKADYWDFSAYWHAGEAMNQQGGGIYELQETVLREEHGKPVEIGPYIYPPPLAVFFGALAWLPRTAALVVWECVLWAAMAGSLALAASLARPHLAGRLPMFLLPAALVVAGPFFADVFKSNVNSLVLFSSLAGLWLVERRRPLSGGMALAGAAFLKVIPVVLLAWLVMNRQWRALAGWALGALICVHLPLLWTVPHYGPVEGYRRTAALNLEFVQLTAGPRLQKQEAAGVGGVSHRNAAINAALARLFVKDSQMFMLPWPDRPDKGPLVTELNPRAVSLAAMGIAGTMFVAGLALAWRRRRDWIERLAGAGLIFTPAMLGNLLCWPYHMVSLLLLACPMAVLALNRGRARVPAAASLVLMVLAATLMFRIEAWWFRIWGIQTLCVMLAWAAAGVAVLRREAPEPGAQPTGTVAATS